MNTKETINNLVEKAKQGPSLLRAGVAAIPWVGGSLDHLLFDRAGEIRMKNVEQAIDDMKDCLDKIKEEKVSKEWFETEEALDMFKNLLIKIEFEKDKAKIKTLSNVYCLFGTNEHKDDPNKNAVLESLSKLTTKQRIILMAVGKVSQKQKTSEESVITATATAIWQSDILAYCQSDSATILQLLSQGGGKTYLDLELDFLVSLNLLRLVNTLNIKDTGYSVSSLGKLAIDYLNEAV